VCAIAAGADLGVSDAVSAHIAPRNGGASVSGAGGVHEALETLSGSFALRHHVGCRPLLVSLVSQSQSQKINCSM
jgi:hypothetical protein